jgi:phosphomannomutase/phosphoglucomutase
MSIFRAYDIRGVYPGQLNGEIAYKIGLAFGKFIGRGTIALGADIRKSSPDIKKHLLKGLSEAGLKIIDISTVPTPVLYFTVAKNGLDGGVMITGSHNPKEYNGIKVCGRNGLCLSYETGINEIEKMVQNGVKTQNLSGKTIKKQVEKEYLDFVVKKAEFGKRMRVVVDGGNGAAGKIACEIFRRLGCDVIELYCEPDGEFPNHHPDPLVRENLKALQETVKREKADIGIAYDGDGDRVGFVDESGEIFANNQAFALLIENVLGQNPGAKIVHEVLASKLVEDVILAQGGVPVLSRVGHSYIQNIMLEKKCALGGETSGHYYFRESYNYDDGIFASVKLVELISKSGKKMSELGKALPRYITSDDTRIHCPDDRKFEVVERLKRKFEGEGKLITLDGVKVIMRDSWFIVRASNTQPALVLRWEAKGEEVFRKTGELLKSEVEKAIKALA